MCVFGGSFVCLGAFFFAFFFFFWGGGDGLGGCNLKLRSTHTMDGTPAIILSTFSLSFVSVIPSIEYNVH